jgi:hypothetical protein
MISTISPTTIYSGGRTRSVLTESPILSGKRCSISTALCSESIGRLYSPNSKNTASKVGVFNKRSPCGVRLKGFPSSQLIPRGASTYIEAQFNSPTMPDDFSCEEEELFNPDDSIYGSSPSTSPPERSEESRMEEVQKDGDLRNARRLC